MNDRTNLEPTDRELDDLLALAIDFAARAAERHRRRETGDVDTKSSDTDPVTQVDKDSEALIVEGIRTHRPDDGIVGEEGADVAGTTGLEWVIDPLDGTVNFIHEFPSHAVSIGVEFDSVPVVGVVHDTAHHDVYWARRGGGAFCNGEPIQVASVDELQRALLGTGFGYDAKVRAIQGATIAQLLPQVADIRRAGSCAVDLCWTARGRLDAFYETGPSSWDVTAGVIVVREAGGVATYDPATKRVLASPPQLWNALTDAVEAAEESSRPR